jgi:HK97 family phage portal protein
MKILDALRGALEGLRIGYGFSEARRKGALSGQVFQSGMDTSPFLTSLNRPYAQHPVVHRAMSSIARNVSRVPFELFKKGTDELVEEHPILELFNAPNPDLRGTQLFEQTVQHLEHWGNSIWWLGQPIRQDAAGTMLPMDIELLPPARITLKRDRKNRVTRFVVATASGQITVPREDVVHFKMLGPYETGWGVGWVEAAKPEFETDYFAQQWNKRFFQNGAELGSVLQAKDGSSIGEVSAERILTKLENRHRGWSRSHRMGILPDGLEYVRTGTGQKDMDFGGMRRLARENTLTPSGVPPAIAGVLQFANYANMGPQLRVFFELEVIPRQTYIQEVINSDFLPRFAPELEGRFKVEVINSLLEDLEKKMGVAEKMHKLGVPMTEINNRVDLGLDLEDVDGADVPFLPAGIAPAGDVAEGITPAPLGFSAERFERDAPALVTPKGEIERARASRWKSLVRSTVDLESKAHVRWRDHLARLQKQVLKNLEIAAKGIQAGAVVKVIDGDRVLYVVDEANQDGILMLEPVWRATIGRAADSVAKESGVAVDFTAVDPGVTTILTKRRVAIKATNAKMQKKLREKLAAGVEQGATEKDLKDTVLDFFGGRRRNARTIARTEVLSSFSAGRFEAMTKAGIKRHEWLTSRDGLVRGNDPNDEFDHVIMDSQSTRVGEPFTNGLLYPRDPGGLAGDVINCRCEAVVAGSIIPGEEPT